MDFKEESSSATPASCEGECEFINDREEAGSGTKTKIQEAVAGGSGSDNGQAKRSFEDSASAPAANLEANVKKQESQIKKEMTATTGGAGQNELEGNQIAGSSRRALQNNLVMEKIAKHLPTNDLLNLRQTSTIWNSGFIPTLRLQHQPIQVKDIEDLTELIKSSTEIPFGCYQIDHYELEHRFDQLKDFLSVVGGSVRKLCISKTGAYATNPTSFLSIQRIVEIVSNLVPELRELEIAASEIGGEWRHNDTTTIISKELPNLKKITFSVNSEDLANPFPIILLKDLIKAAVNLEELQIHRIGDFGDDIPALVALRDFAKNLNKLRILSVSASNADALKILVEMACRNRDQLRLQELELALNFTYFNSRTRRAIIRVLQNFLTTQAATLQEINMRATGDICADRALLALMNERPLRLPIMAKLHTFGCPTNFEYKAGTFADNFPALKRFVQHPDYTFCLGNGTSQPAENSHDGVEQLVFDTNIFKESISTSISYWRGTLSALFPAVTKVEFTTTLYDVGALDIIWSFWPSLKSLRVHYKKSREVTSYLYRIEELQLDSPLSGILPDAIKTLQEEMKTLAQAPLNLETVRQLQLKYKTKLGISDLTQLQEFVLDIHDGQSYKLTDVGGYFGLAMASPRLRHLAINKIGESGDSGGHNMSAHCESMIREALGPFAYIKL